jgi:hypothetical protein
MELTADHTAELNKYLNFFHRKKDEIINELELISDEFKEDNIHEELYNAEDAQALIEKHSKSVSGHLKSEITNLIRLSGVYLNFCLNKAEEKGK